ncbi:hypothetical protein L6R52_33690, partial [Myxococcota bacterium]|nr:hypothetical protein [Myxococcota bacterium]
MLTSRPTESTAALRLRSAGAGRVGPYEVLRELSSRAPGALVTEARDADGALWLLELVRCRNVATDAERAERQRHEKLLAQRTAELVSSGELVLSAHGGSEAEHGERVLFWAFEHAELPFLSERLDAGPIDPLDAAALGACLADRLVLRHARGRFDPLLSEHLVRLTPSGDPEPFGVPLAVASEWLAPTMVPARWAPEERAREEAEASGDLWRLGRILAACVEGRGDVSVELRGVVDALLADDPRVRLESAELASQKLHAIARVRVRPSVASGTVDGHPFAALLSTRRAAGVSALDPLAPISLAGPAPSERTTIEAELRDERGLTTELVEGRRPSRADDELASPFVLPDPLAASSWDVPTLAPQETTSEVTAGAHVLAEPRPLGPEQATVRVRAHLDEPPLLDPEAITRQAEPQTPVPALVRPVLFDHTESEEITGRT